MIETLDAFCYCFSLLFVSILAYAFGYIQGIDSCYDRGEWD